MPKRKRVPLASETDGSLGSCRHSGISVPVELLRKPEMGQLKDVDIVIEGEHFSCHRLILAATSKYFECLLTNGMKESRQSEIELKDKESSVKLVKLDNELISEIKL